MTANRLIPLNCKYADLLDGYVIYLLLCFDFYKKVPHKGKLP